MRDKIPSQDFFFTCTYHLHQLKIFKEQYNVHQENKTGCIHFQCLIYLQQKSNACHVQRVKDPIQFIHGRYKKKKKPIESYSGE